MLEASGEIVDIGKTAFLGDLGHGVLTGTQKIFGMHNADLI